LIEASFIPEQEIQELRSLLRPRKQLTHEQTSQRESSRLRKGSPSRHCWCSAVGRPLARSSLARLRHRSGEFKRLNAAIAAYD
jgi:hypothetical protein